MLYYSIDKKYYIISSEIYPLSNKEEELYVIVGYHDGEYAVAKAIHDKKNRNIIFYEKAFKVKKENVYLYEIGKFKGENFK